MNLKLILCFVIMAIKQTASTSIIVAPASKIVNAMTSYVWTVNFDNTTSRNPLIFTFPTQVKVQTNSTVMLGGANLTMNSFTPNSINVSGSGLIITLPSMQFTITNIINPPSALVSSLNFYFTTNLENNLQPSIANSFSYLPGNLGQCTWDFNLCTEQANSNLIVTISTTNPLQAGSNAINIGFPSQWAAHQSKGLITGVTMLVCSISLNGGVSYNSTGVSCSVLGQIITISFSLINTLNSSQIMANVSGVQSPPTKQTALSALYEVNTADSSGNKVDSLSGCTINPICVTNFTNGHLSITPVTINSQRMDQQIDFIDYPTTTFYSGDVIQTYFTPISNLNNCTIFKFWRTTPVTDLVLGTPGTNYLTFVFPASMPANVNYTSQIHLYYSCTSILIPPSEAPTPVTFRFKRGTSYYLQLNGTITPVASVLNPAQTSLILSTTQMGAINTIYTFNFVINQPLSPNPTIKLTFPSDIILSTATCLISFSNSSVISTPICMALGVDLIINFTASDYISAPNNVILIINGLANPLNPTMHTFGITTYYDATIPASRVQYNIAAFNTTYTVISNIAVTLLPSSMTVYTITPLTISLTCPIDLPANATFYLQFPTAVLQLISPSLPLTVNNNTAFLIGPVSINPNNTLSFTTLNGITKNSSLMISLSIRSPTAIFSYSFVTLRIWQANILYVQSLTSMTINVNSLVSMPITITALNPFTGASSNYKISLTLITPHPDLFKVQVYVPSDTLYLSSGSTCGGNCSLNSVGLIGNNSFSFIATNLMANSSSSITLEFTISSFTNHRYTGIGLGWNVSTFSNISQISQQSYAPTVMFPSIMNGILSQNSSYYRNNTDPVNFQINFINQMTSGDYIMMTISRSIYNVITSLNCSSFSAICSLQSSTTSNLLVIKVIPNFTNFITNPFNFRLENIISGANTGYLQIQHITVGSYTANGSLMDQGIIEYRIDCGFPAALPNNCKSCQSNGSCTSCYIATGYFLNNSKCVTSCGDATTYMAFGNSTSGLCQPCQNNCGTCTSEVICLNCANNSFYYYTDSFTCQTLCNPGTGYVSDTLPNGMKICTKCADPFCLQCTTISYGTCLRCNNNSVLAGGICSSSCLNISYYVLNSNCYLCDTACYSCSNSGAGSCILCALGYYNSSGFCLQFCPNGTAMIPSNLTCGCSSDCATCTSANYVFCLQCSNSSLFVYQGQCVLSCPNSTYRDNASCVACGSGCLTCNINTCVSCQANWYLYNNICFTDCNLISQQFDKSGPVCVQCPTGCDTCNTTTNICTSCLSQYTLTSTQCVKQCLMTNSCAINPSDALPLPGLISIFVWGIIAVVIHLISHKNYLPYSVILFSSLVQFVIIIITISQSDSSSSISGRLLIGLDLSYRNTIKGLLIFSLCINYLSNLVYIYIFIKYIKPLLANPKQIDWISNISVIIFGTITNYRFALIAYSKMFPKPSIHIQTSSKLTPIHYLCLFSILLDIVVVVACGIGLFKQQPLALLFMLCLDLLIIIGINVILTIWFVASSKPDSYFQNIKKYQIQESHNTNQNIQHSSEKDQSKINMVVIQSMHQDQIYQEEYLQVNQSHQGLRHTKNKSDRTENQNQNIQIHQIKKHEARKQANEAKETSKAKEERESKIIEVRAIVDKNKVNIYDDINFEEQLKPRINKLTNSKLTEDSGDDKLQSRHLKNSNIKNSRSLAVLGNTKDLLYSNHKESNHKDIEELSDQNDFPELEQKSVHKNSQIHLFQPNQKLIRPKRVGTDKDQERKQFARSVIEPSKPKKEQRYDYNGPQQIQEKSLDDFQMILRKKIQQSSSIRKGKKQNYDFDQQQGFEDISPSKYNMENQRLDPIQFDEITEE